MKIITSFVHPSIPAGDADWAAYIDPEGFTGRGKTEREAIEDLVEHLVADAYDEGWNDGIMEAESDTPRLPVPQEVQRPESFK